MRNNILITLLIFLAWKSVNAQHNTNNFDVPIPNILPPSPSASFKTDFGNLPINEYQGMPSVTIPIYSFNQSNIAHNISLNYSKLGVKVNDVPDIAGVSWLLNVGGIINRTVYEYPDEKNERYLVSNPLSLNVYSLQEGSPEALSLIDKIKNVNIDNEVDVFSFSVDNYSGTFYLDQNLQPILLQAGNGIKIQTVGNFSTNYEFIMTVPNGKKYFFGGSGFTEQTYNRDNMLTTAITGFYLSKIQDGNNIVEFNYYTDEPRTLNLTLNQSKSLTYQDNYGGAGSNVATTCSPPPSYSSTQHIEKLNIRYSKKIKEILFGDNKIVFSYLTSGNQNYGKIDNLIILNNNLVKKQIDFHYLDSYIGTPDHRFFLEKVSFFEVKDNQKFFNKDYKLEYDDPLTIPKRMSKSIDVLGYYNGQPNSTYIPNLALLGATSFNEQYDADRRAYFTYSKKGTLKSISYPTKGKTNFEYESVPTKTPTYNELNFAIGNNYWITADTGVPVYEISQEYQFNPIVSDKVKINLQLASEAPTTLANKADVLFEITDKSNNQVVYTKKMFLGKLLSSNTWDVELTVDKLKTYLIKFKVQTACVECNGTAKIEYQNGYQLAEGMGLRLKRQFDTNDENDTINIKRIYYSRISDINNLDLIPQSLYSPGLFTSIYYKQFYPQSVITPGGDPWGSGCFLGSYFSDKQSFIQNRLGQSTLELMVMEILQKIQLSQ